MRRPEVPRCRYCRPVGVASVVGGDLRQKWLGRETYEIIANTVKLGASSITGPSMANLFNSQKPTLAEGPAREVGNECHVA